MHQVGDEENPVRQRGVEVFGTELHDLLGGKGGAARPMSGFEAFFRGLGV